jgi:hypothetical protein
VLISWLYPSLTQVSGLPSLPNPTGIRGWTVLNPSGPSGNIIWGLGGICLVAAAVSVFVRYRRSTGEERLQLKWFAYAAVVSLALLVGLLPTSIVTRTGQVAWDLAVVTGIGLALPVAIGIAVLKYRLYAINKIISRTLAYAIVTGLLVGVYAGLVLLATQVFKVHSTVAVAASTLAAAALFNPLRIRRLGVRVPPSAPQMADSLGRLSEHRLGWRNGRTVSTESAGGVIRSSAKASGEVPG